jgi:hypothetical protein
MIIKSIVVAMAGIAVSILLSEPVIAARAILSDEAIDEVAGAGNDYTFSGNSSATVSLAGGASGNVQIDGYQWSDDHSTDQSQNKGGNNQSGFDSQVQQNISGHANALFMGSVSQNVLISSGGAVGGSQNNTAYSVVASGGF